MPRIDVGGLSFDVAMGGPADGAAVLLLHGFPERAAMWDGVLPALHEAGLRTVAPDQRGYSPGARPPDVAAYRMDELVGDALGLLDALELPAAHVLGHDWGAVVGWHLAARHPARVRTLTAVSVPHPAAHTAALRSDPEQQRLSEYIRLFRQPDVAEERLLADDARRLRRMLSGGGEQATGVPEEAIEEYVAVLTAPGALTAALNWYRAMSSDTRVDPIEVPTTYVWSDGDAAIGRTAAEACANYVTGDYRFVELPGITHWIPEQAPEQLARAILDRIASA